MSRSQFLWAVNNVQNSLQCITVEAAARMYRQWRRLVDDDNRLILIQNANRGIDIRFCRTGQTPQIAFSCADDLCSSRWLSRAIDKLSAVAELPPLIA